MATSTREELQSRVIAAVLDLFGETGTASFCLPVPGTTPTLYVAAGEVEAIRRLLPDGSPLED